MVVVPFVTLTGIITVLHFAFVPKKQVWSKSSESKHQWGYVFPLSWSCGVHTWMHCQVCQIMNPHHSQATKQNVNPWVKVVNTFCSLFLSLSHTHACTHAHLGSNWEIIN